MRTGTSLAMLLAVALAAATAARADDEDGGDPYKGAEPREVRVGEVLDLVPPGVLQQLVCDRVGELIEVVADETTLHVHGLAPGVTACSITGMRDRDDSPSTLFTPDGGRSGMLDFRWVVKITVLPKAAPAKKVSVQPIRPA